ncbi:MAG TPA: hypothetical protein PLL66_07620 [Bacteroidales bacterium]|nr:hypothetical protein [Bacteroidales bacterium]
MLFGFVIISIITSVFFNSCKEDNNNSFCGTVYDMSTEDAVQGVHVYLDASKVTTTSINSAYIQIAETTTDASGKYYMECDNDSYLKFRLRFVKDGFHDYYYEFEPEDYAFDYSIDCYFARESFLDVRILNINPYAEDDEFKIKIIGIDELCTECCSGEFRYYYGAYVDTSFQCKTVGNDTVTIYTISIHDDESEVKENKVYCIPGDTVFYDCYY